MRLVQSLHDLRVSTRAQRKKLSAQVTPENGNTTDTTAANAVFTLDQGSNDDQVPALSSAPFVESVEDDDSSIGSPSMPDLQVHHPTSDSDSDDNDSTSRTSVPISPNASQAFAPSSQ